MPTTDLQNIDPARFAGPAGLDTTLTEDAQPAPPAAVAAKPVAQSSAQSGPAGLSVAQLHATMEAGQQAGPAGPSEAPL
eukprot:4962618-Alexandrium_andersonii.AAC.1